MCWLKVVSRVRNLIVCTVHLILSSHVVRIEEGFQHFNNQTYKKQISRDIVKMDLRK